MDLDSKTFEELDFKRPFEATPGLYLFLDPNFFILAASDALLPGNHDAPR
jgi:hypothetical protein